MGWTDRGKQSELGVVDEFPLLTLLDALNREAQLFFELVVRIVIEVAHTCMNTHNGLQGVETIFCRVLFIVNIGCCPPRDRSPGQYASHHDR